METTYYPTEIPCGFPSPALDHKEERISLDRELIKNPSSTFIVECRGDSMINAFIPPRARLVVDRSLVAKNGDIVLAVVNGEFTIKYLKMNERRCWLVPANRKYTETAIHAETDLQIWGVVSYIITDTRDVRSCMV